LCGIIEKTFAGIWMNDERIITEAPTGRTIDIEEIVDSIDPDPRFTVVYPARQAGQTDFKEYDPYEFIED